jgi:Rieske Fe-S protein
MKTIWETDVGDLLPEGQVLEVHAAEGPPAASAFFVRVRTGTIAEAEALPDGSQVVAFLNVCPHMGCTLIRDAGSSLLSYDPDEKDVVAGPCSCHGSTFDLVRDGLVVLGPSTANLPQLTVTKVDRDLKAELEPAQLDPRSECWPEK